MEYAQDINDYPYLCHPFHMGGSPVSKRKRKEGISCFFYSYINWIGVKHTDGGTVVYLGDGIRVLV